MVLGWRTESQKQRERGVRRFTGERSNIFWLTCPQSGCGVGGEADGKVLVNLSD